MLAKWRIPLLCSALVVGAEPGIAVGGTVTVNGVVLLETCTINGGVSTFGVALPTMSTSLFTGAGSTAGVTPFSIALTNCAGTATLVNTYFENGPTINTAGRLINQTVGGASVDGQIKNADGSVVNLAAPYGSQNTTAVSIVGQSATKKYTIAYYAKATPMTAGAFSSSVVYTVMYQ
jgi:major type 1 subunit fimbrin (pilin)